LPTEVGSSEELGRARVACIMMAYRIWRRCHPICISHQSLRNEFQEEEAESGILEVHLPYLIVVDLEERSGLLAYDTLRSLVLLGDQAKLADDFALFQHNVCFNRAKPPA
jgi:hypothetical protein